jgi:CheY-like chemotaxis protein
MSAKRTVPKYKYKYVMLLDDSELDNFINRKVIESAHFAEKIFVNTSGVSALEFFKNLLASDVELFPEVIFVDINMPMMDGFQFIEHLKGLLKEKIQDVKLAILTSSVNPEDQGEAALKFKEVKFFNKPLTKEMLDQI